MITVILLKIGKFGQLRERGKMELSCPLGVPAVSRMKNFSESRINKSFIDQACSVKMAGYWPRSFFCEFMDLDAVSVHKHAQQKNLANN